NSAAHIATFSSCMPRALACTTPFPYTTLFRSPHNNRNKVLGLFIPLLRLVVIGAVVVGHAETQVRRSVLRGFQFWCASHAAAPRSEEHTSELQSRFELVCRLLLEKQKEQSQAP